MSNAPMDQSDSSLLASIMYAITSAGGALASFAHDALPVFQLIGCFVAIAAGIASYRASMRANRNYEKANQNENYESIVSRE